MDISSLIGTRGPRREIEKDLNPAAHHRIWLIGLLCLALGPWPAAAQQKPAGQISLADAVQRALAQHPSVGAARAGIAEARAERGEAQSARYPTVGFSAQATQFQEPMLVAPLHGFDPGSPPAFDRTLLQGGPSLSYTLFDGGAREARIRLSGAQVDAAEAVEQGAAQRLTARVVAGYLDVLGKAGTLDAHRQRIEALRAEEDRVRQLLVVGRAAQVEQLRVEAVLASSQAEWDRAAGALDVAERDLARLIGLSVEQVRAERLQPVNVRREPLDREKLLIEALRESPAVEEARRRTRVAEASVSIARSAYLPRVGVVGSYLGRGSSDHTPQGEWSAGVQISVPLFTGGANGSRVEQAMAGREIAGERVRLAELDAARDLDRALARMRETEARIASLEVAAERFAEVVRTERLALDVGAGMQTDYLSATVDLLQARASLAEAHYLAVAARAEVALVTGGLTPLWIADALEVER
jgi:outer membrane protein TolC